MTAERQQPGRIRRRTMAAELLDELRQRILSQDLEEGAQLRQDSLATEFGVSRIPVREALLQLEGEGLVTLTAHRGYTVTRLSLEEIRELFDLRALIEVDLLRRAIPKMTAADISAAREVLATFADVLERRTHEREWGSLNWKLHSTLYAAAKRERSLQIAQNLNRNGSRYVRLELKLTKTTNERARQEHARLVDLCEQRDTAEATRLLNEHILAARDDLIEFLACKRAENDEQTRDGAAISSP